MPPARGFAHLGIVLHTPQRARTYVPWHELTVLVRQPGGSNRRVQNSTKVGKTSSRWHVRRRAPRDDVGAAGVAAACKLALLPRDQWMDAASNSQRFHSDRGPSPRGFRSTRAGLWWSTRTAPTSRNTRLVYFRISRGLISDRVLRAPQRAAAFEMAVMQSARAS